jgi:hypothetical protein
LTIGKREFLLDPACSQSVARVVRNATSFDKRER